MTRLLRDSLLAAELSAAKVILLQRLRRWLGTHRVESLLFFLLFSTYAYFYQTTQHNESARFDQLRAVVEDATLAVDKYSWMNTADVIDYERGGVHHYYPNKAPGTVLLALTPFWIWSHLLRVLPWPEWLYWHAVAYLTVLSSVGLFSALAAAALYSLLKRTIAPHPAGALLAVLAVWLGTLALPFATLLFSHQLAAAELALAFVLIARLKSRDPGRLSSEVPGVALAGLLAGHTVASEYPTALLAGWLALYAGWLFLKDPGTRGAGVKLTMAFGLGLAAGGLLLVFYNLVAFGRPFYIPYQAYSSAGSRATFPVYTHGILGMHWPGWQGLSKGILALTFGSELGLLHVAVGRWAVYACNPVLWLAIPGLVVMLRHPRWRLEGLLVAGMSATYLVFNACYGDSIYDWGGGGVLGARHLIPLLPFLALPLSAVALRWRHAFAPLCLLSVFYMLIATAVEPRVQYGVRNAARDVHLPMFREGHLALARDGLFDTRQHRITGDSVAFNWGKLMDLPARWQLAPLLLVWVGVGGALLSAGTRAAAEDASAGPVRTYRPWVAASLVLAFAVVVVALPKVRERASQPQGLSARYYAGPAWEGEPLSRAIDDTVDFNWSTQTPYAPPFSVRWEGSLVIEQGGKYQLVIESDDGSTLEIDGRLVIDNSGQHSRRRRAAVIELTPGSHALRLGYVNYSWGGWMRFSWRPPRGVESVVPPEALRPDP